MNEVRERRTRLQIPVFLAVVCVCVSLLSWTLVSGLKYGPFYGVFSDPPSSGFAVHGPNYYQSMNIWYLVITLCFAAYVVLATREGIDGFILRIAVLCIAVYPFFNMLSFKYDVIVNSGLRDYTWLQNSIYTDVFCLVSIVSIMTIEIFHVLRPSRQTKGPNLGRAVPR